MQFTVYSNTGKSAVYPLLLDVTSDIIGQLNRRILLPVEKYQAAPARNGWFRESVQNSISRLMSW